MPTLPGPHLVIVHADFALASFEARLNAGTCLDDPCQFRQRWLLEGDLTSLRRREVVMVAVVGVLIGGIPRGLGLQCSVIRQGTTGNHQPFLGSTAFALDSRLNA